MGKSKEDLISSCIKTEPSKINTLILEFKQLIQDPIVNKLQNIPHEAQNDCILQIHLPAYKQAFEERAALIKYVLNRIDVLRNQPEYLSDLEQIVSDHHQKISLLNQKINDLYEKINSRLKLITPHDIKALHLNTAYGELKNALEYFLLSFCTINLQNSAQRDIIYFQQKLSEYISELHELLTPKTSIINNDAIESLNSYLKQHLEITTSTTQQAIRKENIILHHAQIDRLIKNLLPGEKIARTKQTARIQLADIYDLIARVQALPIRKIIDFNTLMTCKKMQHANIIKTYKELELFLQSIHSSFQPESDLFIEMDEYSHEVAKAQLILQQLLQTRNKLPLLINEYKSKAQLLEQLQSPLERLDKLTSLQHEILKALEELRNAALLHQNEAQFCFIRMEDLYRSKRQSLGTQVNDTLSRVKSALQTQSPESHSKEIAELKGTLQSLVDTTNRIPLKALSTKKDEALIRLNHIMNEIKSQLKIKWAKQILSLYTIKNPYAIFKPAMSMRNVLAILDNCITPLQMPILSQLNPFTQSLEDLTRQANIQIPALIEEYANLERLSGDQLLPWTQRMTSQNQLIQSTLIKRQEIIVKSETIESRFKGSPYLTSLAIIKTLNQELIRILNRHLNESIKKNPDLLKKSNQINTDTLLNSTYLNKGTIELLNLIDHRLIKLIKMRSDFQLLNSRYINMDLCLCREQDYLINLFKITVSQLQNNNMEEISKSEGIKSTFVYWIRVNILKPLMEYYYKAKELIQPYLDQMNIYWPTRSDTSPPPASDNHPHPDHRFFIPKRLTPFGCKTEHLIIDTGLNALNILELELELNPSGNNPELIKTY